MKRKICFLFLIGFSLFLFHCGKKKEKEEVMVQPERIDVKVEIPSVSWEKSLAVLPLTEKNLDSENEIISEEMKERLFSGLSQVEGLKVLSPSSADMFEAVEVDYLLRGEVGKENERIAVMFRLDDARKDSTLWVGSYEEDFHSIFAIEASVSSDIAKTIGFSTKGKKPLETKPLLPQAFDSYLEGKSHLAKETREETNLAVQKFKQALRMDSTFALACVGLAESYLQIIHHKWDQNLVWLDLAQKASFKAVQLDSNLAEAYLRTGQVYLLWGHFKKAEKEFRKALRINPNLVEAWVGLGKIFIQFGLYEPSLEVYHKALTLNPMDVLTSLSRTMVLIGLNRYREAENEISQMLRLYPDKLFLHTFLALLRYYQDDLNKAMKEVEKGIEADEYGPLAHAVLAMIYARQGKFDTALEELELHVKPYVRNDASLATAVAAIYAQLKQNGQAIEWLKKAVSLGYKEYLWLANDPNFKGLRKDARFVELMEELKSNWENNSREYQVSRLME